MNNTYFEIIAFFYIMKNDVMIKNFKKHFFSEPTIVAIFDIVQDFILQYKTAPTIEQVYELVKISGKSENISEESLKTLWNTGSGLNKFSEDWLQQNIGYWGKWRSFYTGLENTIAYIQTLPSNMEYTDCERYINKASNIFNNSATFTINNSEGHDFFDPANHIIKLEDTHSTGYKFVDLCLNGGFTKKGLYVIMGAPKVGKSMWLCNLAANSVKSGYNTIYITLEMSYQLVSQRIGANLFNISIDQYKQISNDANYMTQAMRKFYNDSLIAPGKFIIEEFPTSSATATDIESFVLKKEAEISNELGKPFKFQNICIDYINIMKDQRGAGADNSYTKIKNICEDVRACAQRNEWSIISLTQTNRSGQDASDLNMTNVSESSGLVATVDALFGIIQTNLMRASNVYYLKALALRNSPHMGDKKKYNFDPSHLKLTEDTVEDIIPDTIDIPAIYRSATANAIKNSNNFSNKPSASFEAPAQTSSIKTAEEKLMDGAAALFG